VKNDFARPVIIHRAILGSVERLMAILTESTGGKWPFWLSPRQLKVLPVSAKFNDYARLVLEAVKLAGYAAELDETNHTLNKKVMNAQTECFNFMAVVGLEEANSRTVDLRDRDSNERIGKFTLPALFQHFASLEPQPSRREQEIRERTKLFQ
jgi:threonyl-tRNA synthetase